MLSIVRWCSGGTGARARATERGPGEDMDAKDVQRVGVVGCGLMGSGIVEVAARAGCTVRFVEGTDELVVAGLERIRSSLSRAVDRGKLEAAQREEILARIDGGTSLRALADSDLVIEAATEDLEAKIAIFREVDGLTEPEAVLASNTSSIPIVELALATGRPDRIVGLHFFNPPPVMPLLELTPALTTSEETVAFAVAVAERFGKTVVRAKDHAGFIVNRLLIPFVCDAARLYDDGFATREDIDTAVSLGLGHPMGPLALADFIGIDTCVSIADILFEEFGDPRYAAPPVMKRMAAAGHLGRKSGRGFYEY
jgi:3-hydroxybutyryl-CoA dehydrogenase